MQIVRPSLGWHDRTRPVGSSRRSLGSPRPSARPAEALGKHGNREASGGLAPCRLQTSAAKGLMGARPCLITRPCVRALVISVAPNSLRPSPRFRVRYHRFCPTIRHRNVQLCSAATSRCTSYVLHACYRDSARNTRRPKRSYKHGVSTDISISSIPTETLTIPTH